MPHFQRSPTDSKAERGMRVVLECEVAPRSSITSCSWSKSGTEVAMDSRHWLQGCSLVIDPVQGADEGSYVCSVKTSNSQLDSRAASLEVLVEPGVPSILEAREGDWVEVEQGEELLLTCESQGGRPHAELQWRDAEGQRGFGHVEEEVKVKIGANTELSCSHQGGTVKWTLNSKEIEGETGNILSIEDFTADFDNSVVRCLQEKMNGETRLLRQFKLLQQEEKEEKEEEERKP